MGNSENLFTRTDKLLPNSCEELELAFGCVLRCCAARSGALRGGDGCGRQPRHTPSGRVSRSNRRRYASAASRSAPHISGSGHSDAHTAGRRASPKSRQRNASSRCGHGTPAGLPCGIPGNGDEIEGAMQHAPQPARQSMPLMLGPRTAAASARFPLAQKETAGGIAGGFLL